jgi:predicted CoA-binding protein
MKTLVLGASVHGYRYANKAIRLLRYYKHDVVAVGLDDGMVEDVKIVHDFPKNEAVDTVTMYLSPVHQKEYYDRIVAIKPRRIIFNPGAENGELVRIAKENGIATEEACTLVLLNTGQY